MYKNKKGAFSLIEIIVSLFIFSLGITSVYTIISSTLRLNDYNKNYVIASNLAREQIEQVRNIRDSNYKKIQKYNQINPSEIYDTSNLPDLFKYDEYYSIENDYSTTGNFPINVSEIPDFGEGISELNGKMELYRLCIDGDNRYTYDCITSGNLKTKFYKYISIEKVEYKDGEIIKQINNSFLLTSKVIWYIKGYHEFEVKSIIADWKRL